jgi:hypothetical protein
MKKLFFIGFLATILIIPTASTVVGAEEPNVTFLNNGPERTQADLEAAQEVSPYGSQLRFYALPPCRILDTRNFSGPPLPAGVYIYYAAGLCGVPFGPAKAISINTAVTQSTGPGNLRHFPYPDPIPGAAYMNYGPIPGLVALSNAGIVPICDTNTDACGAADLSTFISRATHFIVDVNGYFAP